MKLIDSDRLRAECIEVSKKYENDSNLISRTVVSTLKLVINLIDFYPKADAVPVVLGHWVLHPALNQYDVCSACGTGCLKRIYKEDSVTEMFYSFCPNCGAKMYGEREEND